MHLRPANGRRHSCPAHSRLATYDQIPVLISILPGAPIYAGGVAISLDSSYDFRRSGSQSK